MLPEQLRLLRGTKTQQEVADAVEGLSRQKLSHYEIGRSEPDLSMLQRLADYYDVSVDFILGRPERKGRRMRRRFPTSP